MMAGKCTRGRRSERGQALAEFALVLPLVLLFIAGIVEMGRAWNIKQAVTDAAREGARYSVVDDPDVTTMAQVQAKIEERLALAGVEQSDIVFSSADCASVAACWRQSQKEMTVSVSTQFRMALIGTLLGWAGGPTNVTISTNATMRNEGGAAPPAP
jgi:Flp pilus assembly protein TadG